MNPRWQQLINQARGTWRYRWLAMAVAAGVAVVGWAAVFALPDAYQASALVLVDARTALTPALQGLAVQQDVGVQLNYVRESLLADTQLRQTAAEAGIFDARTAADPVRQERALARLRKSVHLLVLPSEDSTSGAGTTYQLLYQDLDRLRALRVVKILLDTFVNETLGGKQRNSESAQEFLQTQVQDYEKRLRTSEDRLAEFKSRHLGQMPSEQGGYFAEMQKENDKVEELRTKLLSAESRRNTLQEELRGDSAVAAAAAPGMQMKGGTMAASGGDTVSRIAETQAHLDDLLLRFTDQHPDVIATRQVLAELKQRRAAEIEGLRNGDASAAASSGASANPVFQSTQVALNQANVEIADLRIELGRHEAKARQLSQFLGTAPQVEAEYAQLTRDYDVNKAQYTALLSNLEKARVGGRADEAGSVRFEVVQPPIAPLRPTFPPRLLLLAGILLGALLAGGGVAFQLNKLHPVVLSADKFAQLLGVPVVATFGAAFASRTSAYVSRQLWGVSGALTCLLVAFAAVVWMSHSGVRLHVPGLQELWPV